MSSTWPPSNGLTTKNVPRKDAILASYASITINAPASLVFDVLCDTSRYGEWNSFCPRVTIHSQPEAASDSSHLHAGTLFTYHVIMDAAKPNKEFATYLSVTDVSTPQGPSSYIPTSTLEEDGSFSADLQKLYRISWSSAGSLMSRGLRTERFHEIIASGDNDCEVRTWECQGGVLAHTVKWMYKKTLMEKFQMWCNELKKQSEGIAKQEATAEH